MTATRMVLGVYTLSSDHRATRWFTTFLCLPTKWQQPGWCWVYTPYHLIIVLRGDLPLSYAYPLNDGNPDGVGCIHLMRRGLIIVLPSDLPLSYAHPLNDGNPNGVGCIHLMRRGLVLVLPGDLPLSYAHTLNDGNPHGIGCIRPISWGLIVVLPGDLPLPNAHPLNGSNPEGVGCRVAGFVLTWSISIASLSTIRINVSKRLTWKRCFSNHPRNSSTRSCFWREKRNFQHLEHIK